MPTPLVLESTALVIVDEPLVTPSTPVTSLHVVSPSVPVPTLVDGRPV